MDISIDLPRDGSCFYYHFNEAVKKESLLHVIAARSNNIPERFQDEARGFNDIGHELECDKDNMNIQAGILASGAFLLILIIGYRIQYFTSEAVFFVTNIFSL